MSSLQIWLAIVGGVILVVLVAYNAWTSRQNQPKQAEPLITPEELDALTQSETSIDGSPPLPNDALGAYSQMAHEFPQPNPRGQLDPLIDVMASMELETPVSGEAALAALPPVRRVGSKLFIVEGLNADTGEWENLQAGLFYSAFQAGIQVANRQGPLNDIEFSEFVVKAQTYADAFGVTPELPDMSEAIAHARELDQFAASHDAQLSFTIASRKTAWSPGYVQQQAARIGFVPGVIPGRMVIAASSSGLPPVLVLSFDARAAMAEDPNQSALRSISLGLDVPQVAPSEQAFSRLCESAQALAQAMDGQITDDNGQVLSEAAIQIIDNDLKNLYQALAARDLAAGSLQARRLFS
ncbi:MAG: cell division protein FtsZ [Betaproteobacteria bacterium]|nr:cell division protein FtsZ [Betaproteobacteria bacterium]NBY32960.1 cell division protein FtsZ [Betaproteobacteria bacterium]